MAQPKQPKQRPGLQTQARDRAIEQWAQNQIDPLIDADTPPEERERRIHRLTEGPPEFVNFRFDLPGRRRIES